MAARKPDMEKIHKCTGTCGRLTRPSRMLPLASVETFPRTKGGLCQKCYSVIRRAEAAKARAEAAKIVAKSKPRPETARPDPAQLEEERIRHIAAGLDRFQSRRPDRRKASV
jgi:hypothetical protein